MAPAATRPVNMIEGAMWSDGYGDYHDGGGEVSAVPNQRKAERGQD